MIASQFLFLFSALGAVNGILLAAYLFTRKTERLANGLLGALLLAISVRTGKSTFYYFNPDLASGYLQFGLSACLFIGPLTYLYLRSQLAANLRWRRHLAAPALAVVLGLFFPYGEYRPAWLEGIMVMNLAWLAYLVAAALALWRTRVRAVLPLSVLFGSALILAAYLSVPFTSYIVGAVSFTFSIHLTILCFVLRADTKPERYQNRKLSDEDARGLLAAIEQVMGEQQLYLNPNLNLAMLAKKVGKLQTTVSQVLNERLGKSFNHYVNELRIEHAKQLLVRETHLNMDLVAERSGFNSNSTFFAAFKKITSQTPASYRAGFEEKITPES